MNVNNGLHNLSEALGIAETARVSPVQRQASTQEANPAAAQDQAQLSTAASLADHAMQVPDVRMDKVAAMQQALMNGTYSVSVQDVADKLVQQMLSK